MRWRVAHRTVGYGHLYQGRFKSFPVRSDEHLLTVLRYIERNALGTGLVARAEHWRWSGLWARMHREDTIKAILAPWPVERPVDWTDCVNAPLSAKEFGRVRVSIERGRPFGEDEWVKRTASELRLEHTIRPEGRPPKPRSRVEVWRGGLGRCLCSLLARSFGCGCHIISTMLRFHTPLIKPGGRISRTRLSDKAGKARPSGWSPRVLTVRKPASRASRRSMPRSPT